MALLFGRTGVAQPAVSQPVLTQTVGTSAFQVVTTREVRANEMVARALEREIDDTLVQVSPTAADHVLTEIAVFREAQSLAAIKIEDRELQDLVQVVRKRLEKSREWKKLDVSEAELKTWVERKKVSTEFIRLKAGTLAPIVTDQEIQEYYDKNRVKFGSTPLESQKANIKIFLQKENQKQRVQEWVQALRTKYQIRNDFSEAIRDSSNDISPADSTPAAK